MPRRILTAAGILGFVAGLLFMLQGLGILPWPRTSMMIGERSWVMRGAVIALLSAILVAGVRFVGRRRADGR